MLYLNEILLNLICLCIVEVFKYIGFLILVGNFKLINLKILLVEVILIWVENIMLKNICIVFVKVNIKLI